jgi:hypothetical protein
MFVLICNSGDGAALWSTFKGLFGTHDEAHTAMVECIEAHRRDWVEEYSADEEVFATKVDEDMGHLIDGDEYDWRYYEKYFIFDTEDEGNTFAY